MKWEPVLHIKVTNFTLLRNVTFTRAGSLGKLKNLFGGRLKIPRLTLTMRFGHPDTTHFTMLRRVSSAAQTEPSRANGTSEPRLKPLRDHDDNNRPVCLRRVCRL